MTDMTNPQKKYLRQLAGQCYEKEMSLAHDKLYDDFNKWKNKEISNWDLNEKIHQYHDSTARGLWKIYEQMNDPSLAICHALANDIIKVEDIEEECRSFIERKIDVFNPSE